MDDADVSEIGVLLWLQLPLSIPLPLALALPLLFFTSRSTFLVSLRKTASGR